MMRVLSCLLIAGTMLLSGCGWVKDKVGIKAKTTEEVQAEIEEANARMKEGDNLVQKWATKVKPTHESALVHHEGLTEADPWGNFIQITYSQSFFTETAVIRSAGPDGKFDTADDLKRERSATNVSGVLTGNLAIIVPVWLVLGVLALIFANTRRKRRIRKSPPLVAGQTPRQRRGVISSLLLVLLGGFALIGMVLATLIDALLNLHLSDGDCDSDSDSDSDSPGGDCDSDSPSGDCDSDSDCG